MSLDKPGREGQGMRVIYSKEETLFCLPRGNLDYSTR